MGKFITAYFWNTLCSFLCDNSRFPDAAGTPVKEENYNHAQKWFNRARIIIFVLFVHFLRYVEPYGILNIPYRGIRWLERKFEIKKGSIRANTAFFGNVYCEFMFSAKISKGCSISHGLGRILNNLDETPMHNTFDIVCSCRDTLSTLNEPRIPLNEIGIHLAPIFRKRCTKDGIITNNSYYGRYRFFRDGLKYKEFVFR